MVDSERVLATFLDLVRIDSPSGAEDAFADHVAARLEALGAKVRRDAYGNLIARLGDSSQPFLLGSHLDTVEPGRGIRLLVEDGVVRTDGSTVLGGDPKSGVAAILEGIASLREEGAPLPALEVVLTRGEESGLEGSAHLDYSLIQSREGVEFDGEGPVHKITVAAPGRVSAEVRFGGRGAHAGVEPESLSAIKMAARFVDMFPQGRIDAETTANIGLISGGTAANAVPEAASLTAGARSRDAAKLQQLRDRILEIAVAVEKEFPGGKVDCRLRDEFGGYRLDPDYPLVARVTAAMRSIGFVPELIASGGATDANNFAARGIDVLVVGLGGHDFHTVRESLPVTNLVDAARFCEALLRLLSMKP